jgi:hypothetical protein
LSQSFQCRIKVSHALSQGCPDVSLHNYQSISSLRIRRRLDFSHAVRLPCIKNFTNIYNIVSIKTRTEKEKEKKEGISFFFLKKKFQKKKNLFRQSSSSMASEGIMFWTSLFVKSSPILIMGVIDD